MVIKSNDRLAHITSNHAKYYYCYALSKLLILTTSALRDCVYNVY